MTRDGEPSTPPGFLPPPQPVQAKANKSKARNALLAAIGGAGAVALITTVTGCPGYAPYNRLPPPPDRQTTKPSLNSQPLSSDVVDSRLSTQPATRPSAKNEAKHGEFRFENVPTGGVIAESKISHTPTPDPNKGADK